MHSATTLLSVHPLAVLKPDKQPRSYTLAEYLRREERSIALHEYYNGIITKLPMAKGPHNIITMNVGAALKNALKGAPKKYLVMGGQQIVYLPALNFGLYPDVLVVVETPEYWDSNQTLLTNPILIVEILSKITRKYDRTEKFVEYKTLDSFQEYVLIEPEKCLVETRFQQAPQVWRDTIVKELNETIYLNSLGISLELNDIYENIRFKK
ncbi:MAG: hypothetical protein RLZZ628_3734 [Bacteroidota bacterium]|jgi:Uma2 family endonuclease